MKDLPDNVTDVWENLIIWILKCQQRDQYYLIGVSTSCLSQQVRKRFQEGHRAVGDLHSSCSLATPSLALINQVCRGLQGSAFYRLLHCIPLNEIDAHRQRERGQRRGSDGLEKGKGKDTQHASFLFSAARYTVHCIITRFKCDCRLNPKVISQNKPASAELILAWLRIPKRSVKLQL